VRELLVLVSTVNKLNIARKDTTAGNMRQAIKNLGQFIGLFHARPLSLTPRPSAFIENMRLRVKYNFDYHFEFKRHSPA